MAIQKGDTVSIEYSMSLEDGTLIDSTKDTDPLSFTQGQGEIINGIENALLGMEISETLTIEVSPEDAFGASDPEALVEVPKTDLPPDGLEEGAVLEAQGPKNQQIEGRVIEVKEDTVIVDFNHPLAGKELHCEVEIVNVVQND